MNKQLGMELLSDGKTVLISDENGGSITVKADTIPELINDLKTYNIKLLTDPMYDAMPISSGPLSEL